MAGRSSSLGSPVVVLLIVTLMLLMGEYLMLSPFKTPQNLSEIKALESKVTEHQLPRFVAYHSSNLESPWLDGKRRGKICETELMQREDAKIWTNYSFDAYLPNRKPVPDPTEKEWQVLSYMERRRLGPDGKTEETYREPIEPLHGFARHPVARVGCGLKELQNFSKNIFDITYLVLPNQCDRPPKYNRIVFFDLGASKGFERYKNGMVDDKQILQGGGLSPSIPLFYKLYLDRCMEFDAIFAWEVKTAEQLRWWGTTPPNIRRKVRFYNVPVDEGNLNVAFSDHQKVVPAGSFLQLLKDEVEPDDYVVVKVDIDTPSLERYIVSAIADNDELASLVDEIFYEKHFYMDGMEFGWKNRTEGDVDTTMEQFLKLRKRGIRSHFWI